MFHTKRKVSLFGERCMSEEQLSKLFPSATGQKMCITETNQMIVSYLNCNEMFLMVLVFGNEVAEVLLDC